MRSLLLMPLILVAGCAEFLSGTGSETRMPEQFIEHKFDGRDWIVGYQNGDQTQVISGWVLRHEPPANRTEVITARISFQRVDLHALVKVMRNDLAKGSRDFRARILSDDSSGIAFEWSHQGSGTDPAQREVKKVMQGVDGIYSIAYTVKASAYSATVCDQWRRLIMAAQLVPRKK